MILNEANSSLSYQEGFFENGRLHGRGISYEYLTNGELCSYGQYTNGALQGQGVQVVTNTGMQPTKTEGKWENGKYSGPLPVYVDPEHNF